MGERIWGKKRSDGNQEEWKAEKNCGWDLSYER